VKAVRQTHPHPSGERRGEHVAEYPVYAERVEWRGRGWWWWSDRRQTNINRLTVDVGLKLHSHIQRLLLM